MKKNEENSEIDTSNLVDKTNDQTIGGVKIFAKSPVVPTPTNNMHTATKKYVDEAINSIDLGPPPDLSNYVDKTTAQIISGVKTFTSIPVTPSSNPTSDNQLTRKGYVDSQVATKISPSEVDTKIAEATSDFATTIQLDAKANQTDLTTLEGRVNTAESNISSNTTAISTKANQSDLTTL